MPRGFLVKRYPSPTKNGEAKSGEPNNLLIQPTQLTPQRIRRYSDEDRSDSSSDHDVPLENPVFKVQDLSLRSRAAFVRATPTTLVTIPVSDPSSPSPPLTDFAKDQEEPLALTTAKINHIPNGRSPTQKVFQSIRNSVLYIPRLEDALPTTPPPLKTKPFPSTPNTAPAALHFGGSTPKTNPPPKKRFADSNPPSTGNEPKPKPSKRHKAVRKLNFDEDKTSPVSGTFIRDIDDDDDLLISSHPSAVRKGDIDPSLNLVVVTEEAKAELAKIENRIGDYVCQLCKEHYQDAFGLAQHRCSRIVHVEYRCPECDKVFNCPANLASHRRWHKPRPPPNSKNNNNNNSTSKATISATKIGQQQESVASKTTITEGYAVDLSDSESMRDSESPVVSTKPSSIFNNIAFERASVDLECHLCGKAFQAHSLLKKHVLTHLGSIENTAVEEDKNGNYYYSRLSVSPPPLTIDMDREDEEDSNSSHPLCGFNIDNEQRQQGRDTGTVSCKFCPATFSSPAAIIRHINKYHPNENRQLALLQMATVRPLST